MGEDQDWIPTADRLIELGLEVHHLLINEPAPVVVSRKKIPGGNRAFVPTVFALAMNSLHTGRAALELQRANRHHVAMPLVRLTLETAVNAQWLVHSEHGLWGFVNEGERQRITLLKKMATSPHEVFRSGAAEILSKSKRSESFTDAAARNFEQMCASLAGGHDLYVMYKLLCESSHAGPALVEGYVSERPGSEAGVILRRVPDPSASGADDKHWSYLTAASMMWAGRALDHLQQHHVHRSRLRQIAKELTVPQTLQLTDEARRDYARKAAEERRSKWKGPKPRSRRARATETDSE